MASDITPIPYLTPGSGDTLFSASRGNQIIAICNALIAGRGQGEINLTMAAGGLVWEINPEFLRRLKELLEDGPGSDVTPGGGSGAGNMNYRGPWDTGAVYAVFDVVTSDATAMEGLYICYAPTDTADDQPGTGNWEDHWTLIGRIFTQTINLVNGSDEVLIDISGATAANKLIRITNGSDAIELCPEDMVGLGVAKMREFDICVNDVAMKAHFLATEPVAV